jgi:spermidine/putrescine transport system permease protein
VVAAVDELPEDDGPAEVVDETQRIRRGAIVEGIVLETSPTEVLIDMGEGVTGVVASRELERMDRTLIEASKDLGAGRWSTFRQVTLPIALPGLVTGSILVFIPMMGEYVIPQLLGLGRTYLMGNALVTDFLEARNWPNGSARAVALIIIMIVTIASYLWFVNRGRQTRETSVL